MATQTNSGLNPHSIEQRMFDLRQRIGYLKMLRDTCPTHQSIEQIELEIRSLKRKHQALKQIGHYLTPTSVSSRTA